MAFTYGFFNAKNLDRVYTAEHFTSYLSSIICDGIQDTYGECFSITPAGGFQLRIGSGKAWIQGHYFQNDNGYILDLSQYADSSLPRKNLCGACKSRCLQVRQPLPRLSRLSVTMTRKPH